MKDYIAEADKPQQREPLRYLTPHPDTFKNYRICPWATSVLVVDNETGGPVLCPVTCKRWGCGYCAPRRIKKLAFLTHGAEPNRMLTLTLSPEFFASPAQCWEITSPLVPELMRIFRKGQRELEYLRVCELHKSGWPHFHLLLRTGYLRQAELSTEWERLTHQASFDKPDEPYEKQSKVVDIRKIDKSFSSFRYLTKYLTKLHRIEWTDRHVSYSRLFWREEDRERMEFPERDILERSELHPWKYLSDYYADTEVGLDRQGNYALPWRPTFRQADWPLSAFDLRIPEADESPPDQSLIERRLFDDEKRDTWEDQSF